MCSALDGAIIVLEGLGKKRLVSEFESAKTVLSNQGLDVLGVWIRRDKP